MLANFDPSSPLSVTLQGSEPQRINRGATINNMHGGFSVWYRSDAVVADRLRITTRAQMHRVENVYEIEKKCGLIVYDMRKEGVFLQKRIRV